VVKRRLAQWLPKVNVEEGPSARRKRERRPADATAFQAAIQSAGLLKTIVA